jgi:plasmid stabilization system protein ParE
MVGATRGGAKSRSRAETIRVKKKVIVRPRADLDLTQHYVYLARHDPRVAEKFRAAVLAARGRIASHASGGTSLVHPNFTNLELRFVRPVGFPKYLIVYQVADDCSFVLRILHGSQDLDTQLRPE